MLSFLSKLKKFALKSLIPSCITLLVAELIGGLFFNLDPVTIFTWFAVAFVVYFSALIIIALVCFFIWYAPSAIALVLVIVAILGGTLLFITKTNPAVDVVKLLEDADLTDSLLGFLKKPGEDYSNEVNNIQSIIDKSTPNAKKIDTLLDSKNGKLTGYYNITNNEDGSTTVEYNYEKFDKDANVVKTYVNTLTVEADAALPEDVIKDDAFINAMSLIVKLNAEKLKDIVIVSETFSAKVKATDTKEVLGVELDSDVYMVITVGRDNITTLDITYESADGKVSISVDYTYIEEVTEETPKNSEE